MERTSDRIFRKTVELKMEKRIGGLWNVRDLATAQAKERSGNIGAPAYLGRREKN
jgi:hypothetical protein